MAEITDVLRLDIDQALRDIQNVETALDRAFTSIDVRLDPTTAQRQLDDLARNADQALGDVDVEIDSAGARQLNDELNQVERNLAQADNEADQLTGSLRRADDAADRVSATTGTMAGNFGRLQTAALGVASAFAAIGAGQILGAALRGANAAIQSFAQLEDSVNAVNVVFGEGSEAVLKFGETAAASAGLSEQAFNQAVVPIGSLLQNFGFDAQAAADASVILVQRAADLASVMGGTVQEALLAVGAALRGEADPLERYGASVSAARVEQFALAEGLAATKAEITPAITLQARYGLILADTAKVAGDFVNTSGDLANAQRIAGAEAQNLASKVGEALAPALEAILAQAPQVINFFESLTPQLAATADEASRAAAGLTEFASAGVLGLGQVGDSAGGLIDIFQAIPASIEDIAGAITGDFGFEAVNAQLDQFNQRLAQTAIRIAAQSIPAAMAKGTTSINAFGQAIAFLAQQDDGLNTVQQAFDRLRIQSGLTDAETRQVTQSLVDQAAVLGLNADEVAFLNDQLDILNNTLTVVGNEVNQASATMAGFNDPFDTITSRFTTFATDTEASAAAAEQSLIDLAASAEAQAARTASAFNLFDTLPDKIKGSFTAAVDALREQVLAIADFDINIAILRALNLDALADDFEAKGIAAADQLVQAINNIPEAIEANELLQGMGAIGEDAFDALVERFVDAGITGADVAKLRKNLASPEVIAAAEEAAKSVAAAEAASYGDALSSELDQLIPEVGEQIGRSIETHWRLENEANTAGESTGQSFLDGVLAQVTPDSIKSALGTFGIDIDLTDEGIETGITLITGMVIGVSSPSAVDRLHDAIVDATNNALEARSPSRVMLDLGEQAGDAFWSGFNQSELTLKTAVPPVTGTFAGSTSGALIGGANVNINLANATLGDAVSDVARMAQIAGSVAATYNAVRN